MDGPLQQAHSVRLVRTGRALTSPYAAGSILIAVIRARTRAVHGPLMTGDSTWYAWVAPRLYRFGLERPTREVVEEFLGGPVSPAALLENMRRMGGTVAGSESP